MYSKERNQVVVDSRCSWWGLGRPFWNGQNMLYAQGALLLAQDE